MPINSYINVQYLTCTIYTVKQTNTHTHTYALTDPRMYDLITPIQQETDLPLINSVTINHLWKKEVFNEVLNHLA